MRSPSTRKGARLDQVLLRAAETFVGWSIEHPAYTQLLFWRPVPGFTPSAEAYAPAIELVELCHARLAMLQQRGLLRADVDIDDVAARLDHAPLGRHQPAAVQRSRRAARRRSIHCGASGPGGDVRPPLRQPTPPPSRRPIPQEGDPPCPQTLTRSPTGIYRICTFVPEVGPTGFTFNQFLVDAEEPLLYHTGMRRDVPARLRGDRDGHAGRAAALDHVRPLRGRRVRCVNQFLAVAPTRRSRTARSAAWCRSTTSCRPAATSACGRRGARPRRRKRRRVIELATPHVPHNWDSHIVLRAGDHDTLFLGDLLHPARQRPGDDAATTCSRPRSRPRTCSTRRRLGPAVPSTYRRARRPEPDPARHHARFVVRRRLRGAAAGARRRVRAALRLRPGRRARAAAAGARRTGRARRRDHDQRCRDYCVLAADTGTPTRRRDATRRARVRPVRRPAARAVAGGLVEADRVSRLGRARDGLSRLGMAEFAASVPEQFRQMRAARRPAGCSSTR